MTDSDTSPITLILHQVQSGDETAAQRLLPLVYDELRQLAAARMAQTPPGQTLQPTALVHEAYIRLVGEADPGWQGRRHFFGAAARAMRLILIDQARRKSAVKHGGDRQRVDVDPDQAAHTPHLKFEPPPEDLMAIDDALKLLEQEDPDKAEIVMLRYFIGLTRDDTAAALGVSTRTIDRQWEYIRAWLHRAMYPQDVTQESENDDE